MKRLILGGVAVLAAGFASVQFATADNNYMGVAAFAVDRVEIDVDATSTLKLLQHDALWTLDMYEGGYHIMTIDEFAVSRVGQTMLQLEQLNGPLSLKVDLLSSEVSYGDMKSQVEIIYPNVRVFDDIADQPTQATVDPRISKFETMIQNVTNVLPL